MISYPFPPNASAGAVRSERFARYLQEFGWAIDVVAIKPRHDLFKDKVRLDNLGKDVKVHFTFTFDPWLYLREKSPKNPLYKGLRSLLMKLSSFPDHMLFWVPFALNKCLKICRQKQIHAIYTTSPPHSSHLTGLMVSMITGKPWVSDFRDPWTLNAHRASGNIDNILFKLEKAMEKKVLKKAKLILTNTDINRKNLLRAFPETPHNKVVTLTNGWEEIPLYSKPDDSNELVTIIHAGKFYPKFRPYALFHALASWRDSIHPTGSNPLENVSVILLGAKEPATIQIVNELKLNDIVHFSPWVPLNKARERMSRADILWASLGSGPEAAGYIPSKLFEYISARRPIWGFFPEGDAASLIRNTNFGKVFTDDNPAPVIEALESAINEKKSKGAITFQPNNKVIARYRVRYLVEKLSLLLSEMLDYKTKPDFSRF